jgi:hypothetical protein
VDELIGHDVAQADHVEVLGSGYEPQGEPPTRLGTARQGSTKPFMVWRRDGTIARREIVSTSRPRSQVNVATDERSRELSHLIAAGPRRPPRGVEVSANELPLTRDGREFL